MITKSKNKSQQYLIFKDKSSGWDNLSVFTIANILSLLTFSLMTSVYALSWQLFIEPELQTNKPGKKLIRSEPPEERVYDCEGVGRILKKGDEVRSVLQLSFRNYELDSLLEIVEVLLNFISFLRYLRPRPCFLFSFPLISTKTKKHHR